MDNMNVAYTMVFNLLLRLTVVSHAIEAKGSILLCIALFASLCAFETKEYLAADSTVITAMILEELIILSKSAREINVANYRLKSR